MDPGFLSLNTSQKFRRIAGDDSVGRNVFDDDASGAHDGIFSDGHTAKNGCIGADGGVFFHSGGDDFPVCLGLQFAAGSDRTGVAVVDEHDPVAHEHVITELDAFADEGVALDFAVFTDAGVLLHLNEWTDPGAVADGAAVQVDKIVQEDVFAESDGVGYFFHFGPFYG